MLLDKQHVELEVMRLSALNATLGQTPKRPKANFDPLKAVWTLVPDDMSVMPQLS